jgi:hypothetical protein
MTVTPATTQGATPGVGIPFVVASRPQRRYSSVLTVNNLAGAGSFPVVQLPATGWVRRLNLLFSLAGSGTAIAGAYNNDAPFNLINAVTVTDATGQPIFQPISGYNLYLVNKWLGVPQTSKTDYSSCDPRVSPEFATSLSATVATATFRLSVDFEQDSKTGYGCIPNLDSNASLQLKVDYAPVTQTGINTLTASTLSMRVEQEYWAPVASTLGGVPVDAAPPGAGDFREIRYETQTVSASSENLVTMTNRGGLIQGVIFVSRNAGVRTAFTAQSNVGILLDNQPINEGIPLESHNNQVRRETGFNGADVTNGSANPGAGVVTGVDTGVVVLPFWALAGNRSSWLNTRAGSLFQAKLTPGASATSLEIITGLMQVKDAASFYAM